MKSLGVYACTLLLLVGIAGGFLAPEKAYAQEGDQANYNYFQGQMDSYFQAANTAIEQVIARDPKLNTESGEKSKKYVSILSEAYYSTFNLEKSKGVPAAKAQLAAIVAFNTAKTNGPNLSIISNEKASSPFRSIITQLAKGADSAFDVAGKIDRGVFTVGSAAAGASTVLPATLTNAAAGNQNSTGKTSADTDPTKDCSILAASPITNCLTAGVTWLIKNILLQIGGFLVWLAANMFNYSIKIGILEFSSWAPDALYGIWVIIRQIISLMIVFVGLYLGFMYILGKGEEFKKFVPWLVMFALFVNFSYPLARTAIDISNVVSLKIYTSAMGTGVFNATADQSAGAIIMSKLGLQELAMSATSVKDANLLGAVNSIPGALLAVAFVFYTAYILFMVTWIIVMRTVALIFLMVASPLLLVDSVLPILGEKAKLLRQVFFEQLAVGPIFMIMLALTLKFLDVFKNSGRLSPTGGNALSSSGAIADPVVTFFNLTMMLVMLWLMMKVTRSTSGAVGKFGTDMMGKVGGFGLGVATGGAGFLARKGIGGLAMKARESSDKWVQKNPNSLMARGAYNLSNSVANSSFDIRNTAVAGKMAGLGMGMGMGVKMGYEGEAKKKVEEIQARSARIKTKHERDVYNNDGELVARKGESDLDGLATKERFYQNNGGALFLTKKQKDELNSPFVDESSSEDVAKYKKITDKDARSQFIATLKEELNTLKKDGKGESARAQAVMRSIFDTTKQEQEDETNFIKQLEKEYRIYTAIAPEKKASYLSRLEKDMSDAVLKMEAKSNGVATPLATPPTSQPEAKTGDALRQERIQKVEDGRAQQVQNTTNGPFPALSVDMEKAKGKQQASAQKAVIFSENRNQNTSTTSTTTPVQSFDVTQAPTLSFKDHIAAKRQASQDMATKTARLEMATNKVPKIQQVEGVEIPTENLTAPTTPASNEGYKGGTVTS